MVFFFSRSFNKHTFVFHSQFFLIIYNVCFCPVYHVHEKGSTEVHKYDALDAYEMFYENYSCGQNTLFLLSSKDDLPICPDDIKALRYMYK